MALALSRASAQYWPVHGVRASSVPWFVLEKLAAIAFVLALLALVVHKLRRLPHALHLLGGETLAIFVFHLQVIYGGSWALGRVFARSLPWSGALCASFANLVLSVAFAFAWRAFKQRLSTSPVTLATLVRMPSVPNLRRRSVAPPGSAR
jgi:hypothetical protein